MWQKRRLAVAGLLKSQHDVYDQHIGQSARNETTKILNQVKAVHSKVVRKLPEDATDFEANAIRT